MKKFDLKDDGVTYKREAEDFSDWITDKRQARFKEIDKLSKEQKAVVHDWGYNIVDNFIRCGVTKPKHMRHLIRVILDDTRPEEKSYSKQG
jgi:hypothetical protein